MNICKAAERDIPRILAIYDYARAQMRAEGNPGAWADGYPNETLVRGDMAKGGVYLVTDDAGEAKGVFTLLPGPDPTYTRITDGSWPDDEPYMVIHRIAAAGEGLGIFDAAVRYAETRCSRLRIDTRHSNTRMRRLMESRGFVPCGTIFVADGSPRLGHQKTIL